jgi:2-methylcitrate dehydratase PrpD
MSGEDKKSIAALLVGRRNFIAGVSAAAAGLPALIASGRAMAQTNADTLPSFANRETISIKAAEWLGELTWDKIPKDLAENTKLRILDLLGVMLATTHWDEVVKAHRAMQSDDQSRGFKIIGKPEETSLPSAAFVNGVLAAILEFDDTHSAAGIHVTAPNVSVAFPAATSLARSGKDLIVAVLGGGELTCRLGLIGPRISDVNMHGTGLFGTFGAAYTLSKLRNMALAETVNAIGIAGSLAVGARAAWDEGTDAKSLQVGIAASSGVRAVSLATQGLTGPSNIFEAPDGFYRAHIQDKSAALNFSVLTNDLGKEWETLNIAPKLYPTGWVSHPFMEAAVVLRKNNTFAIDDIAQVTAFGGSHMSGLDDEERAQKLRPLTSWHARVSTFHQIAEALVIGKIDKNAFVEANLRNSQINALATKVFLKVDPKWSTRQRSGGRLEITFRDGSTLSHTIEDMRGTRRNPISEADYIGKFRSNAEGVIPPKLIDETVSRVLELESVGNVASVLAPLSDV